MLSHLDRLTLGGGNLKSFCSAKASPDMPAHFMANRCLQNGSVSNVFGVGRNQDQTIEISHACARFGKEVFIPW